MDARRVCAPVLMDAHLGSERGGGRSVVAGHVRKESGGRVWFRATGLAQHQGSRPPGDNCQRGGGVHDSRRVTAHGNHSMAGETVMRVRVLLAVALATVAVSGASSQTRTADGVAALARGDYQQAIAILQPIAEEWSSQDAAAQFFMAGLYEHGHGVPADPLRACALYARAGSNYDSPFGRQA